MGLGGKEPLGMPPLQPSGTGAKMIGQRWKARILAPRICPACGRKEVYSSFRAASYVFQGVKTCCLSTSQPFVRLRPDLPMIYTRWDYPTKRKFRDAWHAKKRIEVYLPGVGGPYAKDGTYVIEGPHFPALHTWYAIVNVKRQIVDHLKG